MTSVERVRAHRARKKAAGVTSISVTSETLRTAVEEFNKLNTDLKAKLADLESSGQATALGQQVLSDSDLKYLVESVWFQSEMYREKFRSYRRSLKS
ncbi:MAG: hypothetical protein NDI90_04345 [Nitrospira sp. BO4]|jgi:hypothetical protein|nr:hypothetical protein [Nitrospira sp. BO4]